MYSHCHVNQFPSVCTSEPCAQLHSIAFGNYWRVTAWRWQNYRSRNYRVMRRRLSPEG